MRKLFAVAVDDQNQPESINNVIQLAQKALTELSRQLKEGHVLCGEITLEYTLDCSEGSGVCVRASVPVLGVSVRERLKNLDRYDVYEADEGDGYRYFVEEKCPDGEWVKVDDIEGLITDLTNDN